MLNKTNQFNLTTERFTETTFNNYVNNNKVLSFVVRVKDRFGDHGITALLIMEKVEKDLLINHFLLSCRIFGRQIENVIINEVKRFAFKNKFKNIYGKFILTKKINNFSDFYVKNSFKKVTNQKFLFNVKNFEKSHKMKININVKYKK